ncbi:ABC transporter ATP-binding protein [Silvibacterium dinghuense]|uniref:ABC transporter ATP-binding protein n=1 Tax=Silvibacterium dinghuense TaxID=1560006 RepID=A0A4Q1SG61_9BACT|nr:ABC transporter ATP-binding protein [Silvibacterium dinghuense]RXS96541.1 ABC transporter ATP-binding protein [Silvibacterium dinghuense]GGG91627.1 multidrug ABC transporter ATP-binding protein [Silvibacterium dinghuense]
MSTASIAPGLRQPAVDYGQPKPARIHSTPAASEPCAQLQAVTKRYGQTLALDALNLTLYPGEVVALLGPNGAGKTTTARLLLGLLSPNSGSVRVMGLDPREASTRTHIGAMLQVSRVPETLKVREHIALFRSYYPAPLAETELVKAAGLEGIEDRLFGSLSGGQKQRVLFALALAGNPELLILDEPTVGMDIASRRALWEQVRKQTAAGRTVLLTTHYLEEADALASRIVVIDKGRIQAEGTPAEIRHRASGRRIRCVTAMGREALLNLPTVLGVEEDREAVVITAGDAEAVLREIFRRDATVHGLEVSSHSLEDAFLALTGDSSKTAAQAS